MAEKIEAAKKQSKNEIAETGGFANPNALSILQEALNGECAGLNFRLDRVKVPAGGATAFELPNEDDEDDDDTEMVKDIQAVIITHHPAYSYYATKYTGGKNPPDCASFDGVHGTGNPGGNCMTCPFNQWGSGEGQSKACKNRRMLYILKEGEIFPMVINLTPSSLVTFTKFLQRQLSKGRHLNQIVTRISLKKESSNDGIAYSQVNFKFIRMLTPAEQQTVKQMNELLKGYIANLTRASLVDDQPAELSNGFVDAETGEVIEPLK